jgi:hypothetical protein
MIRVQTLEPGGEKNPTGQSKQDILPTSDVKVFASHGIQTSPPLTGE